MWVYIQTERNPALYTVGHYAPDGNFIPESDYTSIYGAAARCHYLNGGLEGEANEK